MEKTKQNNVGFINQVTAIGRIGRGSGGGILYLVTKKAQKVQIVKLKCASTALAGFSEGDYIEVTGHIGSFRKRVSPKEYSFRQVIMADKIVKAKTLIEDTFGEEVKGKFGPEMMLKLALSGKVTYLKNDGDWVRAGVNTSSVKGKSNSVILSIPKKIVSKDMPVIGDNVMAVAAIDCKSRNYTTGELAGSRRHYQDIIVSDFAKRRA